MSQRLRVSSLAHSWSATVRAARLLVRRFDVASEQQFRLFGNRLCERVVFRSSHFFGHSLVALIALRRGVVFRPKQSGQLGRLRIFKVIAIDVLDYVVTLRRDPNIVLEHQGGQSSPIYKDDPSANALGVILCVARKA